MIKQIKAKIKWVRSPDVASGLILFFAALLFFYDIFTGRFLFTERDLGPYFIPPRFFWVESIKGGDFPLWNPFQFSGHPFFANPQHAILYPFNTLFFLLPFDLAFNTIILLHFFLGGLFTYLLLRDLRTDAAGSLVSGLIFMLSGYLLSVHSLLNCLLSVVWTPLILMFFRRAVVRPGFKNEILTAVFMALSFLGGGVEIVYGNFIVLLLMVVFSPLTQMGNVGEPFHRLPNSGRPQRVAPTILQFANHVGEPFDRLPNCGRPQKAAPTLLDVGEPHCGLPEWAAAVGRPYLYRFRSLLIVSIVFLLLSAIQFIPFLELWIHSIRGKGISYPEATIWSFAPKDILLFFLPDAYGYFLDMKRYWATQCWLKTLYAGGLPFILSFFFFLFGKGKHVGKPFCGLPQRATAEGRPYGFSSDGRSRKFYLGLIFLSLFLSLGKYNPLYPLLFKYVPFFNGIRYPVKFLYLFMLVLSVTSGLGFQRLAEISKGGEWKKLKNVFIVFSLASGLLLLFLVLNHTGVETFLKGRGVDSPDFNHLSVNLYHAKRFLFYLTLFFLLLRFGDKVKWRGWAKGVVILFLAADLLGNMGFYGFEKTSDYFKKTKIQEMVTSDQGHFRTFTTGKTISMDTPILIEDASPFNVFKEKHLPSMNMIYRLRDVWGIDVIRLKRADDLYNALSGAPSISATNLVDLYGIKYVVSVTPFQEEPGYELIYARVEGLHGKREDLIKENTVKLYRKKQVQPRAWVVQEFRVLEAEEMLSFMKSREFRPNKEVLLEEKPPSLTLPHKGGGEGGGPVGEPFHRLPKIGRPQRAAPTSHYDFLDVGEPLCGLPEFISESNNRLTLRVKTGENGFLVLSDTYYPGWKVYVDGEKGKIYRANYAFRAVPLRAGIHRVEFVYAPLSFKLGAIITFLTIIGCFGMGWISRRGAPPWAPE